MLRVLLCLGCSLAALAAQAQNASPASFARWYGALQYGRQDYQLFIPGEPEIGRTNMRRPQLTAGYHFTPRFALQLGVAPGRQKFSTSAYGTNQAGQPVSEEGWSKGKSVAVPLTGRYTLALAPWKNLHVDVVAGGVVFWTDSQTHFRRIENGITTTDYHKENRFTQFYATLGPSLRYDVGQRQQMGVFADWLFYKNVRSAPSANQVVSTGNKSGITNSIMFGVRYRFDYR